MTLRAADEHSYRTLCLQTVHQATKDLAAHAATVLADSTLSLEQRDKDTLTMTLDILNYLRACEWLEALDMSTCPEVQGVQDELADLLDTGKSYTEVMGVLHAEMIRRTDQLERKLGEAK